MIHYYVRSTSILKHDSTRHNIFVSSLCAARSLNHMCGSYGFKRYGVFGSHLLIGGSLLVDVVASLASRCHLSFADKEEGKKAVLLGVRTRAQDVIIVMKRKELLMRVIYIHKGIYVLKESVMS